MNAAPDAPDASDRPFASDKDDKVAVMLLALDWIDEVVFIAQRCEQRLLHNQPTQRADYPEMLSEARAAAGIV